MRRVLSLGLALLVVSACVTKPLYQSWGDQIVQLGEDRAPREDVSLLLGRPPTRCDPLDELGPRTGFAVDEDGIVTALVPGGPAQRAGLEVGDKITRINGVPVATGTEVTSVGFETGMPMMIETPEKSLFVVPALMDVEQCDWEVRVEQATNARQGDAPDPSAGAARSSPGGDERIFRASCRIVNGHVVACHANWEE
jgi:hypothetical protein